MIGRKQAYPSLIIVKAECQNFAHHRPDLARREIHDRCDLFADEGVWRVMLCDLRRARFDANFVTKINAHPNGGLTRFGEGFGFYDSAGADIDFQEGVEVCFWRQIPHKRAVNLEGKSGQAIGDSRAPF